MPAIPQTAVFNVTDALGTIPGLYSDGTHDSDNSINLNAMVAALLNPGGPTNGQGGTFEFPSSSPNTGGQASYLFDDTISVGPIAGTDYPFNIIFRGTGAQSRGVPLLQMTDSTKDFFVITNSQSMDPVGDDNIAGVVFQDMIVSFAFTMDQPGGGRGIVAAHGNVRLQRVTLDEVPDAAVHFVRSLHCSIIDSDIRVEKVSGGTGVRLGAPDEEHSAIETYIAGTTIAAYNTNGTGMEIYGAEHLRLANVRLEGWVNAIVIEPNINSDNVRKLYFGNVSCFTSQAAVRIVPSSDGSKLVFASQIWFAECEFEPGSNVGDYGGAGVVIGSADQITQIIDNVRFVDCFSCFWPGPGLQIGGGTVIEVLGGHYSCNGNTEDEPVFTGSSSGIAVTGPALGVNVSGATCNNVAFSADQKQYGSPTQNNGVYIGTETEDVRVTSCALNTNAAYGVWVDGSSGAPTGILVKTCDLRGNTSGPVNVTSTIGTLQVVDCAGYNDSQTSAMHSAVPSGVFSAPGYGYYGPSSFYVGINTVVSAIAINGVTTGLKTGPFFLGAGQTAEITYSAGTVPFEMLGQ